MQSKSSYQAIFKERNFMKMMLANMVNRFGDSIDMIAFGLLAYQITNSELWLALIYAFNALPNIVFQPFTGAIIERLNKKVIMIVSDVGRGLLVITITVLAFYESLDPYVLLAFTFLMSCFESIRMPSASAIIPSVLQKENYTYGLSLYSTTSQISQFVGISLAGIIVRIFGIKGALIIDAGTFFVSALLISFITQYRSVVAKVEENVFKALKSGFKYFRSVEVIYYLGLFTLIIGLLIAPIQVLQTPYVIGVLKLQSDALSVIGASLVIGIAIGSYAFPMISKRFKPWKIFTSCGIGASFVYTILPLLQFVRFPAVMVCLMIIGFIMGLAVGLINTIISVSQMKYIKEDQLARVSSMYHALTLVSVPLGSLIVSFLIAAIGMTTSSIFILYGVIGVGYFIFLRFNTKLNDL